MVKDEHNETHFCWMAPRIYDIEFARYTFHQLEEPKHFHDYYTIKIPIYGADRINIDNAKFEYGERDVVMLHPGESHAVEKVTSSSTSFYTISIYPDALISLASNLHISLTNEVRFKRCLSPALYAGSVQVFRALEHGQLQRGAEQLHQEELFHVFMQQLLTQDVSGGKRYSDKRIRVLKEYIDHHYMDDNLSLQLFSELIFLSTYQIIRLFKVETGLSPFEYIINKRIEDAARKLKKGLPVADTAYSCGFYDLSHFHKYFKKYYRTGPNAFRMKFVG